LRQNQQAVLEAATICPRPLQVASRRAAYRLATAGSNFAHWLWRPDVRDRQTDRRQTHIIAYMPLP